MEKLIFGAVGFWSFMKKFDYKHAQNLLKTVIETGADVLQTALKTVVKKDQKYLLISFAMRLQIQSQKLAQTKKQNLTQPLK